MYEQHLLGATPVAHAGTHSGGIDTAIDIPISIVRMSSDEQLWDLDAYGIEANTSKDAV